MSAPTDAPAAGRSVAEERAQRSSPAAPSVPRLAYLCSEYPAVSHTFIMREVSALRALGVRIDTFSVRRSGSHQLLSEADRQAFRTTHAIRPVAPWRVAAVHLRVALSKPHAYAATLAHALRLPGKGPRERLWQVFYFAQAVLLRDECRRRGIRHVHAHLANVAADVAMLAAALGTRAERGGAWSWSFTMHGPTEFFDVGAYRLAQKAAAARFVVCISDFARSQLMALTDPEEWHKLHVVHCGVAVERFAPDGGPTAQAPASPGRISPPTASEAQMSPARISPPPASEAPATILCLGRLVPEKGQAVLLQAAGRLAAEGARFELVLAGEGPSRQGLERLASSLGIAARTRFAGAVAQDRVRELYRQSSIFCLPSFAEGVPVVLMEAMAMQRPVVSTRIAGIPELVQDGETGLIVAPGRSDRLADALGRLLADQALRERLGRRAREKVIGDFDLAKSAARLAALFAAEALGARTEGDARPGP